ncbi:hypothetical protein JCM18750_38610 [Halostagnicola bangensis]
MQYHDGVGRIYQQTNTLPLPLMGGWGSEFPNPKCESPDTRIANCNLVWPIALETKNAIQPA